MKKIFQRLHIGREVHFLGHVVNSNGIHVDPSKIEAVKNWKKNKKYEWGVEQEEAFQTLKDNLCNAPILSLPDGIEDFVVYCDASNQWLGCVLMQSGKDKVLAALGETSKVENATTEMLRGMDQLMERKEDGAHFLAIREDYKMEKLARLYIDEIVAGHGVPVSIILDRDGRFTSRFLENITESLRDAIRYEYGLSSSSERTIQTLEDMLRAWVIDFGGSWDVNLLLKAAKDRQKSYAGNRRKPLEFEVGDQVLLKVSPWKGVVCFGTKGKLAPIYVGPFKILERIGPIAYRLGLPQELSYVHDTFHVSNLKKCLADANLHVPLDEIKINKTLRFVEEPIEIMDREVKSLKRSKIPIVKVHWNSKRGPEFTWECEDNMKAKYP
ncbi:putative reverse transcriptase domain-containing protein [Tanacetum coccineum]